MDKKCLLTFFSVALIFQNSLHINNLHICPIFIRRATKRGKGSSQILVQSPNFYMKEQYF